MVQKETNPLEIKCALDSTHRVPVGEYAGHLITQHSCSDAAVAYDIQYLSPGGQAGNAENRWAYREAFYCPICESHGKIVSYRFRLMADEDSLSQSLERHLRTFHGGT